MIKKLLILSIFLNAFLLYVAKDKIINKFSSKHSAVVLLGNSLTYNGKWNSLLKRSVQTSGFPGFTTSHYLLILQNAVFVFKPTTCFIEGGINDIIVGIPPERTIQNIKDLSDSLTSHNIKPVFQSILYTTDSSKNNKAEAINNFMSSFAASKGFTYIDLNKTSLIENHYLKNSLTTDGIHLKLPAYAIWADEINKHL